MWIFRNLTWISLFWSFFVFELQIDRSQSLERVGGTDLNPETHTIQNFEIPHQIFGYLTWISPILVSQLQTDRSQRIRSQIVQQSIVQCKILRDQ